MYDRSRLSRCFVGDRFSRYDSRGGIPGRVLKPNSQVWGLMLGVGCSKDLKFSVRCWLRVGIELLKA